MIFPIKVILEIIFFNSNQEEYIVVDKVKIMQICKSDDTNDKLNIFTRIIIPTVDVLLHPS